MSNKGLRKRKHNRLLIDMIVEDIKEIDNQISQYSKYMEEDEFDKSNEVELLYKELRRRGLELLDIDE